jgi:hypothetical protein
MRQHYKDIVWPKNGYSREDVPKGKTFWILFDVDNGHEPIKHYCWWFNTFKQATDFMVWHNKQKFAAKLVGPRKVSLV